MKKVSLLALLLATVGATAVSAETLVPGCPKVFQGFGLKGNIGYDVGFGKHKITRDGGFFVDTKNVDLGFRGVDGGVGVDYTHRMCNWALGLAFDANWASTKGKHTHTFTVPGDFTDTSTYKARLRNSLQLYARAGYVIGGQVMPFIGLGWDNSQWKQSFKNNLGDSSSRSKRLNSFLWKVGVDFLTTKHTVLGFEYTGIAGARHKVNNRVLESGDILNSSFRPQNNKFALTFKVIY